MRAETFWRYFNSLESRLTYRFSSFKRMFEHLDGCEKPLIVETGCIRAHNDFEGDGHSTGLFDTYAECSNDDASVFSVDISAQNVQLARSLVSMFLVKIECGDSVEVLKRWCAPGGEVDRPIDLFYLDSFDYIHSNPMPSAQHHLEELMAATPRIGPKTLVVVDDCFYTGADGTRGKGLLVSREAARRGAKPVFLGHQCGWVGMA
jgi:hypothetical protein